MAESGDRLGEGRGGIVFIEDRSCRRLGAELRAVCCKLEVEMGRCRGNKREDRICKLCGQGIEDEKHFLTICTKLDLHRVWMREEENLENSNEDEKSDIILKSLDVPKIARFVLNMWKFRKELLKFSNRCIVHVYWNIHRFCELFVDPSHLLFVKKLRTFFSKLMVNFILSILLGDLIFLFGGPLFTFFSLSELCIIVGIVLHYVYLCRFSWMTLMGSEIVRSFANIKKLNKSTAENWKLLTLYMLLAWLSPLVIVIPTIIVNFTVEDYVNYGVGST